ncbi:entericidin A, partial [Salmonella enterica subsp. enterica]|nr:entericidin A [Salmonella enterica subsp. enterica]EDT6108203.1 entericidin A [Salmonella enterica subsp. enterica serovar 4,[5],12:i:-]EHU4834664.1 entericidin A [Salmonella enterica]HBN0350804.1 entericidin A [Salmonella enterica subsp. enterica serovar Typhimurium]ECE5979798.1 entericidin A [Salmonella enterica subsp. enterica]
MMKRFIGLVALVLLTSTLLT